LICLSDSQLIVGRVNRTFQVKDPLLMKYYQKCRNRNHDGAIKNYF